MNAAYHTTAIVSPGHKIEITVPGVPEGQQVQVVVIPNPQAPAGPKAGPSIFDIVASLKGHR